MAKPPSPSYPPPAPRPPAGPASPPPPAGPRHHRRRRQLHLGVALMVLGGALGAMVLARPIAWLDGQLVPWLLMVGLAAWALMGAAITDRSAGPPH